MVILSIAQYMCLWWYGSCGLIWSFGWTFPQRYGTISIVLKWHFCIVYHTVLISSLNWFIVINGNIISMCVLRVVVYDAVKRVVKLSIGYRTFTHWWSKRSFHVRRGQHLFVSSPSLTCRFFSIIQPFMVKDSNQWKRIMLMWQNK